ncbi:MAG: hypothetical protein ACP5NC_08280, partial [Nitrososphaeria archaeon]
MNKFLIIITVFALLVSFVALIPLTSANASGSVTLSPDVFSSGSTVLTVANGGSFGSGSTVYFYISTSQSSSGIIGGYDGKYTLGAGNTTLSNALFQMTVPSGLTNGTYYILAADSATVSAAEFAKPFKIYITDLSPNLIISGGQPTLAAGISGSGWDPDSVVSVYLDLGDGYSLTSLLLGTVSTGSNGFINAGSSVVMSQVPMGSYNIIGMETSSSSQNYGITADARISVSPYISVTPQDINGQAGASLTVNGYGFPSGSKIQS